MSCSSYDCLNNCCNYYGYCPQNYAYMNSTYFNSCWTFYNKKATKGTSLEVILGGVAASLVFVAIVAIILCCRYKRRKQINCPSDSKNTPINSPQYHRSIIIYPPEIAFPGPSERQPDLRQIYEQSYAQVYEPPAGEGEIHRQLIKQSNELPQRQAQRQPFASQFEQKSKHNFELASEQFNQLIPYKSIAQPIAIYYAQPQTQQPILRQEINDLP